MSTGTPKPRRRLARDIRTDRIGEVMPSPYPENLRAPGAPPRAVNLRPIGGGVEWRVPREYVQLISELEQP